MKHLVNAAGLDEKISVASAACRPVKGDGGIYKGTQAKLAAMNIPFTERNAVELTKRDCDECNFIVGMDGENVSEAKAIAGSENEKKVCLLMSFVGENRDVTDPFPTKNFDATYDDILRACKALLEEAKKNIVS